MNVFTSTRLAILLLGLSGLSSASEIAAVTAKAEQLAGAGKHEEAIGLLEEATGAVIGDPAVAKAKELIPQYYVAWCDKEQKAGNLPQLCRALLRFRIKLPEGAVAYDAKTKLLAAVESWGQEAAAKKTFAALVDFAAEASPNLGDEGKPLHAATFRKYLSYLYDNQKDPAPFQAALSDYLVTYNYPVEELPADMREKGSSALLLTAEKTFAGRSGTEEALRQCQVALRLSATQDNTGKLLALRDRMCLQLGKVYETLHHLELAKGYYGLVANKSMTPALGADARKALTAIEATEKQFLKIAVLPEEIATANVRVKGLPLAYAIPHKLTVKPAGSLIVEKGVCIRGGEIEVQNSTLAFQGTRDAPIVLVDVQIGNASEAKSTITAEYTVFVRCTLAHVGGLFLPAQQKWSLKSCHFIGPAEFMYYEGFGYDVLSSTFDRITLKTNGILEGPAALSFLHCDLDARLLWSVAKANFSGCRLLAEAVDLKVKKAYVQKLAWFDKASAAMASGWKPLLRVDPASSGKLELTPALERIPACGADWPVPSFEKPPAD